MTAVQKLNLDLILPLNNGGWVAVSMRGTSEFYLISPDGSNESVFKYSQNKPGPIEVNFYYNLINQSLALLGHSYDGLRQRKSKCVTKMYIIDLPC